jgi:CHAT domain-containing protein
LSACQTALGDVQEDGIFGLQRGFKKAGVKSLLMSLWKVNDAATAKLMIKFYQNLLNGMNKIESLRNAQQYVKSTPGFESPEYWAGFILLDAIN